MFFFFFGSLFHFSVWVAIYELVHRKKLMYVVYAVAMDQHAHNRCTNGIWHQCPYARQLAVVVSYKNISPAFVLFSFLIFIFHQSYLFIIFTNILDSF